MTEEIFDHYVTDTDVERMADDLAIDEMHNLNFGDLQFVLKGLLRDKYRRMIPTDLFRLHRDRFYYSYSEEVQEDVV
tara:strand:+ start:234 stop:464 length:231 start_codon:yes stop_codon:yes gene_type:complete